MFFSVRHYTKSPFCVYVRDLVPVTSKVVKFDHFETWIMDHLPSTQKFNGVSGAYPVLDNVSSTTFALLAVGHIR